MIDIFEMSRKLLEKLNNPQKEYWEDNIVSWNRDAIAPDGNMYDEQAIYESIVESDRQRLLKFQ